MSSTVVPSATWIKRVGSARPINAPKMPPTDPVSASGIARRRFASPLLSSAGPEASDPHSARSSPAPRTKSRWKGKKPPTIGTKSTPPPMPPTTAMMPSTNVVAKSRIGHAHHGSAGAVEVACARAGASVAAPAASR